MQASIEPHLQTLFVQVSAWQGGIWQHVAYIPHSQLLAVPQVSPDGQSPSTLQVVAKYQESRLYIHIHINYLYKCHIRHNMRIKNYYLQLVQV